MSYEQFQECRASNQSPSAERNFEGVNDLDDIDRYLSKNEPKEHLMVKKKEMIVHLGDERRTSHDNFFKVITMYGIFWINVYKASL